MDDREQNTLKVVVAGAGIAGLATAWLIQQTALEVGRKIELSIFEADSRHGGATRSDLIDGYLCEWGPNGFLDNEPATLKLIESLGLTSQLVRASDASARRYIYHSGRMHEVPLSPPAFLLSGIVSVMAKLRMGMEYFVSSKQSDEDESVGSFGRRRLGEGFTRLLLDPMVSGIFAGDIDMLSLQAVFPKMVEMEREYGGLFKAMIAKQKAAKKSGFKSGGPGGPGATLHTFKQGMGQLTDELAARLKGSIQTGTPVTGIARLGDKFKVTTPRAIFDADIIVLAIPSYAAAKVVRGLDPDLSQTLSEIPYAPVDVVCSGYHPDRLSRPLEGFGVLIPRNEHIRSLGSLWSDQIFPGQAPMGRRLFRTILGGAHDKEIVSLSESDLISVTTHDQLKVMGIEGDAVFRKVYRHTFGIAQYNLGHLKRIAKIDKVEQELLGLFFTGAAYRGVSVNGTAKDAYRVAERAFKGK